MRKPGWCSKNTESGDFNKIILYLVNKFLLNFLKIRDL
jgi:hypothetical protein